MQTLYKQRSNRRLVEPYMISCAPSITVASLINNPNFDKDSDKLRVFRFLPF
jgi:hypothetical protein